MKAKIIFFLIILQLCSTGYRSYSRTPHPYNFYTDSCRYDVKTYQFNIEMSDTSTFLRARVKIKCKALSDIKTIYLELNSELTIESVSVNNQICRFTSRNDLLEIIPALAIQENHLFSVQINYHGTVKPFGVWGGFRNEEDYRYKQRVTWSLSEPFYAHAWFPCKQDLSDKIDTVEMNITVPDSLKAAGNGLLRKVEKVGQHKMCYHWQSTYPIAYYLIFVAAGKFQDYSYYMKIPDYKYSDGRTGATNIKMITDSLLIQNYIYNIPGVLETYKSELDRTGEIITLYSRLFGPYPFINEKYGHVMAPFSGGMEHQTMSLMYYFQFHLVAHELAHQWFGDYVTCSDWKNIFINESMASYCEYLAHEFLEPDEVPKWLEKSRTLALSEPEGSIYIPQKDSTNDDRIFSYELSYKKGALVIHMLRKEIGNDEVFFSILRTFLYRHRFSTASIRDFQKVVEEQTGRSFQQFFDQWIFGSGYPEYTIKHYVRGNKLYIDSYQKSSSSKTPFFNIGMEFLIADEKGERVEKFYQQKPRERFQTIIHGKLIRFVPDPENIILKKTKDDKQLPARPRM